MSSTQSPNLPISQSLSLSQKLFLNLLILAYLALGTLFAVTTPAWQNPDEPAHYNYIAHVAEQRTLPVLQMGDYDEAYLQRLKDEKFPADLPIDPVGYEAHQPPLYYLSAVPVFWLSGGSLTALRLYGVLLGLGVVMGVFVAARTIFPQRPWLQLSAASFAAFLPMQLAIFASVNNDSLAALLIVWTVVGLLRWMRNGSPTVEHASRIDAAAHLRIPAPSPYRLIVPSLLIGLGLLTKATAYILLPLAALVVILGTLPQRTASSPHRLTASRLTHRASLLTHYSFLLFPALLIALPLWLRNMAVYGAGDFLGLAWHDVVVTGQPTTAGWIGDNGWAAYWARAWRFTVSSFWGVFGWLGVFMDQRVYTLLNIFGTAALLGAGVWIWRQLRSAYFVLPGGVGAAGRQEAAGQFSVVQLLQVATLLLLLAGTFAAYVWYNLSFIQHQGRYLFPALVSFSIFAAVGWSQALRPRTSLGIGALFVAIAAGIGVIGLLGNGVDKWGVLLWGVAGGGLLANGLLARWPFWQKTRVLRQLAPVLFLGLLDVVIPFLYSIPQLR